MAVFIFLWIKETEKCVQRKYGSDLVRHNKRINVLRVILKDYKLYSEPQVKYLIEINNEQKENWKFSSSILKPFPIISISVIVPTLIIILKWILDNTKNKSDVLI